MISLSRKMWYSCVNPTTSNSISHRPPLSHRNPPPGTRQLTSSPTLTGSPPNPGRTTRSPSLTEGAIRSPLRPWTPGPTARTRPSGGGGPAAAEGRNRPEAVFCVRGGEPCVSGSGMEEAALEVHAYLGDLDALNKDAVEERGEGLDGLDREGLLRGRLGQHMSPSFLIGLGTGSEQ